MNFRGGGAALCYAGRHFHRYLKCLEAPIEFSAPVRVFSKFMWLGLFVPHLGNLFSQARSLTRYRFENKSPKNFFAKKQSKYEKHSPLTVHSSQINETDFSRFTSHFSPLKNSAFTMAEVLITLGIIGIIAAMTLPSIINKAEKMILKNQFKKTYSTLSQALLKSEADYGAKPECYYLISSNSSISGLISSQYKDVECNVLKTLLLKNLNVIATCEDNAYPTCIPKYKGFDTMAVENNPDLSEEEALEIVKGQGGFKQNNILYKAPAYVLADGSIILSYASASFPKIFAIDINGKKGPNKWGHDLFSFWLGSNEKSNIILIGTSYLVEKGGVTTKKMIQDVLKK